MKTLYLCGAGNPEGVRLALNVNRIQKKWEKIVILDDDSAKHGKSILDVEIAGPFSRLEQAAPSSDEAVNLVARTTKGRKSAHQKIQSYGLSLAALIDPNVDILGVSLPDNVTVYQQAILCANAVLGEGSVVLMRALVGHGAQLGRNCVVAPGAVINARVEIAEGVYVGSNASILPDLKIGPGATIGANSTVVQDVPADATVMGVPGQVLMPQGGKGAPEASSSASIGQQHPQGSGQAKISGDALNKLRKAQKEIITAHRSSKI